MKKAFVFCTLCLFTCLTASAKDFSLTVSAGDYDRANCPVTFELATDDTSVSGVRLASEDGTEVPIQMEKRGDTCVCHFLLNELKAGETRTWKGSTLAELPALPDGAFHWDGTLLKLGQTSVLELMNGPYDAKNRHDTYKVFHHVYDPTDGSRRITKGPGGQFTHHRGLFFGFNKITYKDADGNERKVDIWHCGNGEIQLFTGLAQECAGNVYASQTSQIDWISQFGDTFAKESRTLTAWATNGGRLLDFQTVLTPTLPVVRLDGDPQHAGFHFRADNEVADVTKSQTIYLRPWGTSKPGDTLNWPNVRSEQTINQAWKACSFVLGEKRYSVVYIPAPSNPGESRWSERDYARFGCYFEHDMNGQPLTLNYRLWIQEGLVTPEFCESLCRDYTHPVTVEVK